MGCCWEVGPGFSRQDVQGKGRGECLGHCKPRVAAETSFPFFSLASQEELRFTGRQSTGSWVLWTSLWALAVTAVSKTRNCDRGSQGRAGPWTPEQCGHCQLTRVYF